MLSEVVVMVVVVLLLLLLMPTVCVTITECV